MKKSVNKGSGAKKKPAHVFAIVVGVIAGIFILFALSNSFGFINDDRDVRLGWGLEDLGDLGITTSRIKCEGNVDVDGNGEIDQNSNGEDLRWECVSGIDQPKCDVGENGKFVIGEDTWKEAKCDIGSNVCCKVAKKVCLGSVRNPYNGNFEEFKCLPDTGAIFCDVPLIGGSCGENEMCCAIYDYCDEMKECPEGKVCRNYTCRKPDIDCTEDNKRRCVISSSSIQECTIDPGDSSGTWELVEFCREPTPTCVDGKCVSYNINIDLTK